LILKADADAYYGYSIYEGDETNNILAVPMVLTAPGPGAGGGNVEWYAGGEPEPERGDGGEQRGQRGGDWQTVRLRVFLDQTRPGTPVT